MTHISGGAQNVDFIKLDSLFELSLQEINDQKSSDSYFFLQLK